MYEHPLCFAKSILTDFLCFCCIVASDRYRGDFFCCSEGIKLCEIEYLLSFIIYNFLSVLLFTTYKSNFIFIFTPEVTVRLDVAEKGVKERNCLNINK